MRRGLLPAWFAAVCTAHRMSARRIQILNSTATSITPPPPPSLTPRHSTNEPAILVCRVFMEVKRNNTRTT